MKESKYLSIAELAKLLGISRIAVYKRVKSGNIKAIKIGRSFAVPRSAVNGRIIDIKGKPLTDKEKKTIEASVKKTVEEYGDVLRRLGKE